METEQQLENNSKRVYTTTDDEGNLVEVHEETYFVGGGDADHTRLRLSDAAGDAHTHQTTEKLPDGSTVITTTITTTGDDGVQTEETITETIPAEDSVKVDGGDLPQDADEAGRDAPASADRSSGGGSNITAKPIVAQYVEEEYSEYKPPKRYEKQSKESVSDKLAPKVTIMGLPKDYSQKPTGAESSSNGLGNGHEEDDPEAKGCHENTSAAPLLLQPGGHSEPHFEGGEVENQPVVRTDVVRESDRNMEEELPEHGLARNLLSRFKNIEDEAQQLKQKEYRPSGVSIKATPTPLRPAPVAARDASDASPDHFSESHAREKHESENQPVIRTDVVKESDSNVAEELPESGLARNLLSKFKSLEANAQLQADYKPSGIANKDHTDSPVAWRRSAPQGTVTASEGSPFVHSEPKFEGGDVENVPQLRTDVIRESDSNIAEELPERGLAQTLLSRFKSIENEAHEQSSKLHRPSAAALTPRGGRVSRTSVTSNEGLATDLAPRYEPSAEGGDYESQPQVRTDVVRESDGNLNEELPETGLARNLLSRFKNIESEAREIKHTQYRPSGIANKATPSKMHIMAGRSTYTADFKSKNDAELVPAATGDSPSQPEGGEYESVPEIRTDVVREKDNNLQEELPDQGLANSLLSRFKSLEAEASSRKDYVPSGIGNKPTPTPLGAARGGHRDAAAAERHDATDGAHSPAFKEPTVEGGEFENQPQERSGDIARETHQIDEEELPEQGLASGILSKFKSLEEGASATRDYQPSGVGRKSLSGYGSNNKQDTQEPHQLL